MYNKIKEFIKEHDMLKQKEKVIAGVSGGADSVCLLCVLIELKKEYDLELTAVHVNHCLRGEAADRDEAYVQRLCEETGVPLKICRIDVGRLAKGEGISTEEAGRLARRRAFEEEARRLGGARIALAHHMNDNVETLLLNIARGTGLKGLGGIRPAAGDYIHPLLCVSREEIEGFLAKKHLPYCMDATNYEDTYTRNRIRNHVIPYMEAEINARFADHVCSLAEQMGRLWDYVSGEVCLAEERTVTYEENAKGRRALMIGEEFEKVPKALRPYLVRRVLERISGRQKDLEAIHLRHVEELFAKQTGRKIDLPYNMQACRCYEGVEVSPKSGGGKAEAEEHGSRQESAEPERPPVTETAAPDGADRVRMRVLDGPPGDLTICQTPYTKWFDYDIIKDIVTIRTRRPGDYITIDREGRTQKLKQYFINEKVPKDKRDEILLAADGSHILWVIGYRRGCAGEVTQHTEKILEITIYGGENYGGDD